MSGFTKTKYDTCFSEQQVSSNKSMFDYVVDNAKYVNVNECNNYSPPFLTYVPSGVAVQNIDIENDLMGINKPYTRCNSCKYTNTKLDEVNKPLDVYPHNKKECKTVFDSNKNVLRTNN